MALPWPKPLLLLHPHILDALYFLNVHFDYLLFIQAITLRMLGISLLQWLTRLYHWISLKVALKIHLRAKSSSQIQLYSFLLLVLIILKGQFLNTSITLAITHEIIHLGSAMRRRCHLSLVNCLPGIVDELPTRCDPEISLNFIRITWKPIHLMHLHLLQMVLSILFILKTGDILKLMEIHLSFRFDHQI